MKITIDLNDFWTEEESGNLTDQIKEHLVYNVKQEVWKSTEKLVKDYCEVEIKKQINDLLYKKMNIMITETLNEDKVKKRYSGNEMISTSEWIKEEIERATLDRNYIADFVKKQAESIQKELKNRFDLLFASQLVAKMNESGMLKEDVAKILLEQPK